MNCPYCHSEYEMIRDKVRQGWQCEDCWTFWTDEDLKNIRLGLQGERICGKCQYTFYEMPGESIHKCPSCRSSHIKLAHPEAFDWDKALVKYTP